MPVVNAQERPGAASGHRIAAEIEYLPYATPAPDSVLVCELVAAYGPVEPEYAAIRRGSALFDAPQRGVIAVTGADRREFLQRMVTQDLKDMVAGSVRRAFWLNRKGRIEADLVIAELGDRMLITLDAGSAAATVVSMRSFVFSEDVAFEDASAAHHSMELHGPGAGRTLALAGATSIPAADEGTVTAIGGRPVTLIRDDALGEHGWTLLVARDDAALVWDAILAAADAHEKHEPNAQHAQRRRARPIGWHAYNIARVEAGTPLFLIDFGTANLPHESGLLRQRVNFRKGCYLGQEVVARMESLGKPKQVLVGVRPHRDLLPVAGAQVFERLADGSMGPQIGGITSSTLAPMLGAVPIAFAMLRTAFTSPSTSVLLNAEGEQCEATVGPLRAYPQPESTS